jgi:hypothetical protein
MDNASAETTAVATKPRRAKGETSEERGKQHADSRRALKLRKKKAHRRKINSSNANG